MLKRVEGREDKSGACVAISEARFPSPFASGLEYAAPARGTWNIVHTGMLVPEAHEIFVCASGCLRGVVLTAAEMNAQDRFSTIAIRENNVLDGDMEELIIDGVSDILSKLPRLPRAVLLYTSCIHQFMGCDLPLVYDRLREMFPGVDFTDCYMNPTMRKSGLTPDQLMRRQLYSLLRPRPIDEHAVNILGNDLATDGDSDIVRLIKGAGYRLREITSMNTYDEYQEMASAALNITYNPAAVAGGEALAKRLGTEHMYLPLSYGYDEIEQSMTKLAMRLGAKLPDFSTARERCEKALAAARSVIGDAPVAIDYTISSRPLSLARLLLEHGFNVTRIYVDSITEEEKGDFERVRELRPKLELYSTMNVKMRFMERKTDEKTLAIGQKAAYFTGSDYFVNVVEGGGMYGFDGIAKLAELMSEAFTTAKDARALIQIKGMGCGCV